MKVYINLKEHELDFVKIYFMNKDLVSVEDILYALDEQLCILDDMKQELKRKERINDEDFEELKKELSW